MEPKHTGDQSDSQLEVCRYKCIHTACTKKTSGKPSNANDVTRNGRLISISLIIKDPPTPPPYNWLNHSISYSTATFSQK